MSLIYLAGYEADAIRRAVLSASSQHSEYPAAYAGNGTQEEPFRWLAPAANAWLKADLDFMPNGGFEKWTEPDRPDDWTPDDGTGSLNEETTVVDEGSTSLRIDGDKDAYVDIDVLPGKKYKLSVAIRGNGTNTAFVYVQDLSTLKWLNSSAAWVASETSTAGQQAASWITVNRNFTVELPAIRRYKTTLRITCRSNSGSGVYFDDFRIYPEVNFASLHAQNIPLGATCKLQYDDSGAFSGSETTATTFTVRPRSFYDTFTAATIRYWRILIEEKPGLTPYLGEWSMGPYNTLAQFYRWGFPTAITQPQVRDHTPSGRLISKRRTSDPHRRYQLSFMAETEAARDEVFEDMFEASGWGDEPLIVVPDTDDGKGIVLQTRLEDVFEYVTEPGTTWDYKVVLAEDPYPVEFNF